jgi:mRNA interferase RelE/StbE
MGVRWSIQYEDDVVRHDIPDLPRTMRLLVKKAVDERLSVDPVSFGKPLRFTLKGYRRLRVGDWRVICRLDPAQKIVVILAIKHRKDIYD